MLTLIDFELAGETVGVCVCKVEFRYIVGVDMRLTWADIFGPELEKYYLL